MGDFALERHKRELAGSSEEEQVLQDCKTFIRWCSLPVVMSLHLLFTGFALSLNVCS